MVVPTGVTLTRDGLVQVGTEPTTQAGIYDVGRPRSWPSSRARVRCVRPRLGRAGCGSEEDTGGGIEAKKPMIYERLYWILGFVFAMLAIGFAMLYRKDLAARADRR